MLYLITHRAIQSFAVVSYQAGWFFHMVPALRSPTPGTPFIV